MIRIENLTKYHEGRVVIDDVTLTIDDRTNVGLIGPGGCGKSVLLKIVCGLIKPDKGRVLIDDIDVHRLKPTELAELRFRIGMLFQNYALFDSMNVADNIAFPLRQAGETDEKLIAEKVNQALIDISLPGIGERYPNELSGGMKKRVSFARAVIRRPPIVFYDDPTAGLDPVTSSKIFILLRKMQHEHNTTSVTISHDIEGIKDICDRFAMLDRGRLIFEGDRQAIEACDDSLVSQFWQGYSDDELNV
ncbi:ATP-binding cassette domain-containing protein [Bradymonadaceae bacterium TMQ3]|uniref:ATP-binding cassette domain-containing protein n=1 Tax=Lujinxingia sediminis TaxID=2480984 RepID=A0ABY0CYJ1_9DELT|nr:ATP-binding cassette domain-containing protein [Lujinxingia sediminis]RDV38997.1 ATP-binding cassette domain-containing protein [Bradymonadaceae bacterium TMQ3]RVU48956.1 ATP-binding cassette domain-containing protein [Lujinxingia sediminis]TXC78250.1 ATP-binding cassette domain-containing protein [Bradymonadales bacterium TMQ1]